jgi:hypothetical protein
MADDAVTSRDPVAPEDVRLVIDGREYPCDVLRDPGQDKDGCAAWVAVPRDALPRRWESASVRAAVLPARSLLVVSPPS